MVNLFQRSQISKVFAQFLPGILPMHNEPVGLSISPLIKKICCLYSKSGVGDEVYFLTNCSLYDS